MTRLEELKIKRKAALIGVCTFGLAGLIYVGIGNTWRGNVFQGTSMSQNEGIGFILKIISFMLLSVLLAIPFFIISLIQLIYYSFKINKETERMRLREQYNDLPMGRSNNTSVNNIITPSIQQQTAELDLFDVEYYYLEGGQLYGIFSLLELTHLDIQSDTLLGINSTTYWQQAGEIPNLLTTLQLLTKLEEEKNRRNRVI